MSFLATAYKGMPPAISAKLEAVLLDNIASSNESVRLCAVQWASRLFPFAHPPARYVCVLGAGDKRFDVREEAARGLKPQAAPSKADKAKVRSSSAVGLESKGLESTPGFLQGEYRAGRRVHTPSRVAPPVGRHQLHPQGSSYWNISPNQGA